MVDPAQSHPLTVVCSPAAAVRIDAARRFVTAQTPSVECLLVGDSREAVDEFARELSGQQGAVFGWHRFSLRQLAAKLANPELARRGEVPATGLNVEAVAARSAFEELEAETLDYLAPVARLRSVARTLSSTLDELRHAHVDPGRLRGVGESGDDLATLADRYHDQLVQASLVDAAGLLTVAAAAVRLADTAVPLDGPLLLLDVEIRDDVTQEFVAALAARGRPVLATVAAGDHRTLAALERVQHTRWEEPDPHQGDDSLSRVRDYLFSPDTPRIPDEAPDATTGVTFFSAPGEGRECVEIARLILEEAARGVVLDRIAILLRSPQLYAGLVETALGRAGLPAWFARGTRVPDPAGRAFLALLACAAEQLSARRFSEYLSLAQIPELDTDGAPPATRRVWAMPANADQVVPGPALPRQPSLFDAVDLEPVEPSDSDDRPAVGGTLRAPWQWDRLLVESAVIGGRDRWKRRLEGLTRELELRRAECASDEPESPRVRGIDRDLANLRHLKRFALPIIDRLAALPDQAPWSDWLDALETLAPMVLRDPERVVALLGELRPMARVGPVSLVEVRDVLSERLTELQADPPTYRYGRVFVGKPEHARGRAFDVVFVPGLAERIFPQKQRQDPLLLDAARARLTPSGDSGRSPRLSLRVQDDRADGERLLLRLAVGSATDRLYVSYPRMQAAESRPRVPSFYALDIERARVGRVPDFRQLERVAYAAADARLAWPAPVDPDTAIDDTEHDLAVLGPLLRDPSGALKGRARYLLKLNPGLRRSLLTRWARWKTPWSRFDGLHGLAPESIAALSSYRPMSKPYSVSALQRFATCPYQFLLSAIYRLEPREEIQSLERLDPLTRGRMFHEVQADFVRELRRRGAAPVTRQRLAEAEQVVDLTLDQVATKYYEELAPAIDRVWADEVEAMRTDLKGWVHHVADEDGAWIPMRAEFGFGFRAGDGRDPDSVPEPVTLDGKWILHGVVDLIEAKAGPTPEGELRVTDHKTGRNRTREGLVVGQGEVLQPVLYGLAVEAALHRPVGASRLFFCTVNGEFTTRSVLLGDRERRQGLEVLEIIDRAIEAGSLLPTPREGACRWCDFKQVCGPWEETRVQRKDQAKLLDLHALREMS